MSGFHSAVIHRATLAFALWGASCAPPTPELPRTIPEVRPSDGLLGDVGLQQIVELQVRRDAAALVERLDDPAAAIRARAALALGSVQEPLAVPRLAEALTELDPSVRRDAAFALGQTGHPDAVAPLAEAFSAEADPSVRVRILQALGKMTTVEAVNALVGFSVAPGEEAQRVLALSRLAAVGGVATPAGLDHIVGDLDSPDPAVRAGAAYYFGRTRATGSWSEHRQAVGAALDGYALDDPAAMYLVQGLGRLGGTMGDERVRRWAVEARDWRTRANAMTALAGAWRLRPETAEVLVAGLDDPSALVAAAAAEALAQGPVPPSMARRVQGWMDANKDKLQVIRPLLRLMANMDERDFVFRWADALPVDDAPQWAAVLAALGDIRGDDALTRIYAATESTTPRIASDAVGTLARRWPRDRGDLRHHGDYFDAFHRAFRNGSGRSAFVAAPALADSAFTRFGGVDTLVAVFESMALPDDERRMMAVLGAFAATDSERAGELLRRAADGPHPGLRRVARASLEALGGDAGAVEEEDAGDVHASPAEPDVPLDWVYLAQLGRSPRLILDTEHGRIVVVLATEDAPHTVQTIARLAEEGRFDGVPFHRVVPNFVAQGGDFDSGDGSGGAGFSITSEFTLVPYVRGVIGMASAGKDTEGSQFFFTHSMQPHLDGGYTAFGWVEEGMDSVDRILMGDRIAKASVERDG